MTIKDIKPYLLYETLRGSHTYGTNIESSDEDYMGVYILPIEKIIGINTYVPQVEDKKGDTVYYELNRFIQLLYKSNPTMLESLFVDEKFHTYCHPLFKKYILDNKKLFLSTEVKNPYIGYAYEQIRKAGGLNKKIRKPLSKQRKTPLDFCQVVVNFLQEDRKKQVKSRPLKEYLQENNIKQEFCGLSKLDKVKDTYQLYHDKYFQLYKDTGQKHKYFLESLKYKGIIKEENSDNNTFVSFQLRLSSIPKSELPIAVIYYNHDGFRAYCKEYTDYWNWVKVRNRARYSENEGKEYDSKNLAHTVRLLNTSLDLINTGNLQVYRPKEEIEYLLKIRKHLVHYDVILKEATEKKELVEKLFTENKIGLKTEIDTTKVEELVSKLKQEYYITDKYCYEKKKTI